MSIHPLKLEREAHGWSQARLAEQLDVSVRTVNRWEQGQSLPYPYYREQLCALFGKTPFELGLLPGNDLPEKAVAEEPAGVVLPVAEPSRRFLYDPLIPEAPGSKQALIGREALLMKFKSRLQAKKQSGLTAFSGLPGVGKTALAATLVTDQQVQAFFHDGILWAGVGPQPDVLNLLVRWASLLEATPPEGKQATQIEEWYQILRTVIGQRRILLVLDDVWSVDVATQMQVGGPNCSYLLTTRLPQVAFAFAEKGAIAVPELTEEEGFVLLERAVPDLVAQEHELIRTLVRAVGGLPLALKLLAHVLSAQVFTGQPRRIQATLARLQEAEQRLRLSYARETPLSLQATISISEQMLGEQARQALRALAIFPAKPNSFSEEAARAVAQIPPETLDELWDAGLLESHGPERYQLHQTIIDYAHVQGIVVEARERLVHFSELFLREQAQNHEDLERELNNILAALEVTVEMNMQRNLIEMMDLLMPFLHHRGRYSLAWPYLQHAYAAALSLEDAYGQMKMLQHLASFAAALGEYQQAENYGQRGLELGSQLDQREVQCDLLRILGLVAFRQGNYRQAIASYEQGLELARQIEDVKYICLLLGLLVAIACSQGRYDQAQEMAREGLELARQQGETITIIDLLGSMGHVAISRGDPNQAELFYQEAFELAQQARHYEWQVRLLNRCAIVMQIRGDHMQATNYSRRGMELARRIGHRFFLCSSLYNLGIVMLNLDQYTEAEGYLLECLELARQLNHLGLPSFLAHMGKAVGYQRDYVRANAYFEESVQRARQMNSSGFLGAALVDWGDIHLYCQHPEAAEPAYQEVLALAETVDVELRVTAQACYGLAQVAAQRGDRVRARELGQQSLADFEAMNYFLADEVRQWLQHLDDERQ